jgi:hypothetical protein
MSKPIIINTIFPKILSSLVIRHLPNLIPFQGAASGNAFLFQQHCFPQPSNLSRPPLPATLIPFNSTVSHNVFLFQRHPFPQRPFFQTHPTLHNVI